jgi:hypothetical protein
MRVPSRTRTVHLDITDEAFTFTRNQDSIAAEAGLDGVDVLRTSLPERTLGRDDVVLRCKDLADVERFFRTLNSELDVRPIATALPTRYARTCSYACVLLHQLAHETSPRTSPLCRQRQTRRSHKRANPVTAAQRSNTALAKAARNTPPTAPRYTALPPCSPTWPPSAPTRFSPPTTCRHSPRSPTPHHCNVKPSNSSTSPTAWATRRQQATPPTPKHQVNPHTSTDQGNFGLAQAANRSSAL